jgi:hypothetical protein
LSLVVVVAVVVIERSGESMEKAAKMSSSSKTDSLDSCFLAYDLGCLLFDGLGFACVVRDADAGASPSNPKSLSVTGAALTAEGASDEEAAEDEETARWGDDDIAFEVASGVVVVVSVVVVVFVDCAGVALAGESCCSCAGFGAFGGEAGARFNPANKSMLY